MNKEKLLQLLSLAIDQGADIYIHFMQYHNDGNNTPVSKEEAYEVAVQFMDALNTSNVKHYENQKYADSFRVKTDDVTVWCSYVPGESNEDKKEEEIV
ncbi:hypothetical protein [Neobacillus sedimentimangrovi]|uniref:hypothetical protein n=1 Tax=Neobacillus sedimentimangrovi TaxID=2699460 RepID=UPI0013CFB27E|nr:hypothetical protein [Neobacillus sedimentimangrovi]